MSSVKKELVSGVMYTGAAKYAGIAVALGVTAVLARMLPPEDFGPIAVATVIITFFNVFSDWGIGPAVIQNRQLTKQDLGGIFSFTMWAGITAAGIFFGCSWFIAGFYETDVLRPICQLLSLNLLFASLNIVPNALLFKEKRFRFIAVRNLCVQGIAGIAAIAAAFSGAGIYALTINPIVSSAAMLVINLRENPLVPELIPSRRAIGKIFSFSAYQFAFNFINFFSRNADKLLIGKYMMPLLGYYEKSYRLMMLPLQNITNVVSPVMHPIFSEYQNDLAKLSSSYLKVVRFLAFVGFPLSVFLWFSAHEIVLTVFGGQWEPSVPVFRILTTTVGMQVVLSTSGSVFQAAGQTKMLFISGLLSAVLNVGAICVGIFAYGSLEAVAWGISMSFAVNFIQCYYLMFYRTFRLPWEPFWRTLVSPLTLSAIMCAVLFSLSHILPETTGKILSLTVKSCAALAVWCAYIQICGIYDIKKKTYAIISRIKRKQNTDNGR